METSTMNLKNVKERNKQEMRISVCQYSDIMRFWCKKTDIQKLKSFTENFFNAPSHLPEL